jgi:hypothetical protein
MKEHPEPVVLEAAEAEADKRLTFFTHRLRPSVGPLEARMLWCSRASVRHAARVRPSARISSTLSSAHPGDGLVDQQGGLAREVVPRLVEVRWRSPA